MPPAEAAPLGLLTVAAASLAASAPQLEGLLVNHRLGISLELAGSLGAIAGALAAAVVSASSLSLVLALASALAGLALLRESRARGAGGRDAGPLASEIADRGAVVSYAPQRLGAGVALVGAAGILAGLTGTSGGFIKTPVMAQVMRVPVKAAAATSIFMVGVTAAAALTVQAVQGRIDPVTAGSVVAGGLLGGYLGARVQDRVPATGVGRFLGIVLIGIAVVLVVTA